jgi:hypothetical protein
VLQASPEHLPAAGTLDSPGRRTPSPSPLPQPERDAAGLERSGV